MPAFKTCTQIYDLVKDRWPEIAAEISVPYTTVTFEFPDSVSLTIKPVRVLSSKYEKVSFMFTDIAKIISFDWRNKEGNIFTCNKNPQITIEPIMLGRRSFDCTGNHCHFDPNALISAHKKQPHRVCAIDSRMLHIHYYPHEIEDMCAIIDAVFKCSDDTDHEDRAPLRSSPQLARSKRPRHVLRFR